MHPLNYWRRRLPRSKVLELFKLWLAETSGARAAEISGVSRLTALRHYRRFRACIAISAPKIDQIGEAEVDECYFGLEQRKGEGVAHKRGRSYEGKVVVLGAVDRQTGLGVAETTSSIKAPSLLSFVARKVREGSKVITDGFKGYLGLGKIGFKHSQVNHAKGIWKRGDGHTNRVENLWRQVRRRLTCYNGAFLRWKDRFKTFLKEAVFFFNFRGTAARMSALGVDSLRS
jgi:transposase-like protein